MPSCHFIWMKEREIRPGVLLPPLQTSMAAVFICSRDILDMLGNTGLHHWGRHQSAGARYYQSWMQVDICFKWQEGPFQLFFLFFLFYRGREARSWQACLMGVGDEGWGVSVCILVHYCQRHLFISVKQSLLTECNDDMWPNYTGEMNSWSSRQKPTRSISVCKRRCTSSNYVMFNDNRMVILWI